MYIYFIVLLVVIKTSESLILDYNRFGMRASRNHPIQLIYDSLSRIPSSRFQWSVSNPWQCNDMQACMAAMNQVTLQDLGFDEKSLDRLDRSVCANIAYNENFEVSVFLIPKGHRLSLHDHPNMAVLSKVLVGDLRLISYTPLSSSTKSTFSTDSTHFSLEEKSGKVSSKQSKGNQEEHSNIIANDPIHDLSSIVSARRSILTKKSHDNTWYLTPELGNIHEFIAMSPCAVLDCLLPPYCDPDRPCRYYVKVDPSNSKELDNDANENENNDIDESAEKDIFQLKMIAEPRVPLPITIGYRGIQPMHYNKDNLNDNPI